MKRKLLLLLAGFAWFSSQGQLVNDGATIVIQPGATLFVESSFQNVSGTLDNQGTIEVMGDFSNDAGSSITNGGLIKFTGTGASNVILAGDALNNVEVNKTTATGKVNLSDAMTINGGLTLTSGNIVLGMHDLTLGASVGTIGGSSFSASKCITTNMPASGQLIKTMSSAGAYTFPVGDGTFYAPLTSTTTGISGSVSVAVENAVPGSLGANPNYLTRNWKVNTTGFTSNALVGTYNQGNDVVGTESLIKGATLTGMTWSFTGSTGNAGSDMVGATAPAGNVVFSGLTTLGTVKLKAFLAGAYSGGTMTTALRTAGLIPLSSPYAQAAASVGSIPANVTDWVLLEITNPSNGGDPAIYKSAFILNNGSIVDTDGTSDPQILGAYNPSFVRVMHRNHLSVRTGLGIDTQVPTLQDFTTNTNVYQNPASISYNQPQRVVSGTYMMWGGNTNGDNYVTYLPGTDEEFNEIPSDALAILTALGNNISGLTINTYSEKDSNLDGYVTYLPGTDEEFNEIPSDALNILTILGNNISSLIFQH